MLLNEKFHDPLPEKKSFCTAHLYYFGIIDNYLRGRKSINNIGNSNQ